jgi:uncharacterized damage-inducible protein DinB
VIPILQDYFDSLTVLHDGLKQAISGLPAAALDWTPGPDMNSMAVLVVHTAAAEQYWIANVAGGQDLRRDRPAEFQTEGLDEAALLAHLDRALVENEKILAQLTADDLTAMRRSAMHDRESTAMWALLHALEHTAIHLGHLQVTRQVWEQANVP